MVSGIASWGVEKVSKELTDDVNKALEGFRTQNRTHHIGKEFTKAEKDEKQEGQTTALELNRESQQKIKDILEGKPSTIDDVPLLSKAIKRPIVIYKNGKVFDTIGSEFPGEPLHISHTPEGVGHWAPYDTSIKVEASGENNCLHDTALVLLGTKACQEIGIKTAAELRNLEVKEITNNPALANELMKEAAKLSILKPTAMMQGGRPMKKSVWDLKISEGNHIKNPTDTKKKESSKASNDRQEVETASDLLDIPSNPGPRLLNPYAFANLSTSYSFVGVPEKLLKIMRLPNQKLIYEADTKAAVEIIQQMREGQNLKEEKAEVYEGKMAMEQEEKTGIVTLENAANLVKQYLKDLEENKEPILLKKQGVELLKQIEMLKKKEKKAYREEGKKFLMLAKNNETGEISIRSTRERIKTSLNELRQLKKSIQNAHKIEEDGYSSDEKYDLSREDGGVRIPKTITLSSGKVVKITFGISKSDHRTADNLVNKNLLQALEQVLNRVSQIIDIQEIVISCTTNGDHAIKSNHYPYNGAKALDISQINGETVEKLGKSNNNLIDVFQESMDKLPNVRENFGPCFLHKKEKKEIKNLDPKEHKELVKLHEHHIHFSINQ